MIQVFDSPLKGANVITAHKGAEGFCPVCRGRLIAFKRFDYWFFKHKEKKNCNYNEMVIPMRIKLNNMSV